MGAPPSPAAVHAERWWEHPWLLLAIVLAMAVPLLGPDVPPLVDLPGHMGRYRVQLDGERSAALSQYYSFQWALIGNLGVDLLVEALAPALGLEPAVRLIVLLIPPLSAGGMLFVAREVHGRLPPTAFFALPLAYGYPFHFGFVNFALSMALALIALGLWLRLGRLGRTRLRAAVFVPLGAAIWVCHAFGWGALGALAFSAEVFRARDRGARPLQALLRGGLAVLPLTPPFLLMLAWRSESGGGTEEFFLLRLKAKWLLTVLRDRWQWWDLASLALVACLFPLALASRRLSVSRTLGASAVFLFALFLFMPAILFGSAYADMRLAPFALAAAVLAVRLAPDASGAFATGLAVAGLLFLGARLAGTTASFLLYDRAWARELAALDRVPRGARVAAFVGEACEGVWLRPRFDHLPSLAIVRREAFANDQWTTAGAQLIRVKLPGVGYFGSNSSQIVAEARCRLDFRWTLEESLARLPRDVFTHVWLIDPPPHDAGLLAGLRPVWRGGRSVLLRLPPADRRDEPGVAGRALTAS